MDMLHTCDLLSGYDHRTAIEVADDIEILVYQSCHESPDADHDLLTTICGP